MSYVGKHRGWLLVYEIQYWIFLILIFVGVSILQPIPIAGLLGALFVAACWAIAIWSLYWSTDAVRRGHIIWCWILAAGALVVAFNNSPYALNSAEWRGEFFGSTGIVLLWIAWALYWQKSARVKNSYSAPGKTQIT